MQKEIKNPLKSVSKDKKDPFGIHKSVLKAVNQAKIKEIATNVQ